MMPMMTGGGELIGEGSKCQDCGNNSKKDCLFMRCRTCCKSKGFLCQTHVNSTWVSAHRRRRCNRNHHHLHQQKSRMPSRQIFCSPGEVKLPGELAAVAVFRCLRVRSLQDGEEDGELAYQTSMSIGGRKFKGILYDQGPESCSKPPKAANSRASAGSPPIYLPPPFSTSTVATATQFLAPPNPSKALA